jgi:thiol-disulfide isomerase/thioredoxin
MSMHCSSHGSRLPDFSVTDLQGRKISSADLQGKVVLIDFWATWCSPCKKEMPGYQKLLDRDGSRGLMTLRFGQCANAVAS